MRNRLLMLMLAASLSMSIVSCHKNDNKDDDHISASQVPSAVMSAFNTRYPTASGEIEWQIEHGAGYKVKFFIGSQRWEAVFASNGSFISEEKH